MWKLLGLALLPKLVDKIEKGFDNLFSSLFVKSEEPTPCVVKSRKASDTTQITSKMAVYIRKYHALSTNTGEQDTTALNQHLGLNKSRSSYTRIWHPDFNCSILPTDGEASE